MFELVVIWDDGEDTKQVYEYTEEYLAKKAERDMRMVFGNQIKWIGVRKKVQ